MWPTELTLLRHPSIHSLEVGVQPKTLGFPAELLLLGAIRRRGSALPSPSFITHSRVMTASDNIPASREQHRLWCRNSMDMPTKYHCHIPTALTSASRSEEEET